MKIGIITFHFAHNQGAVLQCYALQKALKKLGEEPFVIDYCPLYHTIRYQANRNPFITAKQAYKSQKNKGLLKCIIPMGRSFLKAVYLTITQKYKKREENFNAFISANLPLSKKYKTLKALKKNPPPYDVYISGSDQLWNPELVDGTFDPAYFLDFGNSKKITYAVSMKEKYTEAEKEKLINLLKLLDDISVREKNDTLDEITKGEYTVSIDPTLLLDMEDYEDARKETNEKEPYIFVYGFQTNADIINAVETISADLGIKVINGSPEKIKLKNAENLYEYGPDKFLSYIKNAQFVVTNSFHGTAFSLIYHKQFMTIAHTTRGRRMVELLGKLDLSDRLWQNNKCSWQDKIDYQEVEKKRTTLRQESIDYLTKNLKIEK